MSWEDCNQFSNETKRCRYYKTIREENAECWKKRRELKEKNKRCDGWVYSPELDGMAPYDLEREDDYG